MYGHIVLSASNKFDAKVIKAFTSSYFSHSFITVPPMIDREMCLEASSMGVSECTFEKNYQNDPSEEFIVYEFIVPQEIKDYSIGRILDEDLQVGYGYLELPWFAWRRICKWFGKDIRKQDNWSQSGIICSELVATYIRYCGFESLFASYGNGSIAPQDLYEIILKYPELFREIKRKISNPNDKRLVK